MDFKVIRSLAKLWAIREHTLTEWRRFNDLYKVPVPSARWNKPKGPRWGQPGRGRRRKARFAARRRERDNQWMKAEVKRMFAEPGTMTAA